MDLDVREVARLLNVAEKTVYGEPVDFRAVDGKPVRILFTLLSPSVRAHLQLLSRLAFALNDEALRNLLFASAADAAIFTHVAALEDSRR